MYNLTALPPSLLAKVPPLPFRHFLPSVRARSDVGPFISGRQAQVEGAPFFVWDRENVGTLWVEINLLPTSNPYIVIIFPTLNILYAVSQIPSHFFVLVSMSFLQFSHIKINILLSYPHFVNIISPPCLAKLLWGERGDNVEMGKMLLRC